MFDEVDAGIGGHTARAVGARLRELAEAQAGAVHHPPAPDRLARRAPFLDRQGHLAPSPTRTSVVQLGEPRGRSRARAHARRRQRRYRRAPPRARSAPRRLSAPSRRGALRRSAGVTLAERMAATRDGAAQTAARYPARRGPASVLRGRTRRPPAPAGAAVSARSAPPNVGDRRRTRAARAPDEAAGHDTSSRGDIALIDHLDIDRVSAEELIAAGAVAVLNCRPSSGGSYPEPRAAAARRSGHPARRPARRLAVRRASPTAIRVHRCASTQRARRARLTRRCCARAVVLARGEVLDLERVCAETEARRREIGEALERFAHNTIEHMREERELLAGQDRAAALRHRLPRPLDARRRPRRGPPARPARPAPVHPRHAPA